MKLTELPVFDQAMSDGTLSDRELQVWRASTKMLDVVQYRVLKIAQIESLTKIARSTISVCCDRLCALGYLVRRREGSNTAWEYRIPLSRAPITAETEPSTNDAAAPARRPRRQRSGMVSRGL